MSIEKGKVCRTFTQLADGSLEHTDPEDGTKGKVPKNGLDFTYVKDDGCRFKYTVDLLRFDYIVIHGGLTPESNPDVAAKRWYRPFLPGSSVTMAAVGDYKTEKRFRHLNIAMDSDGTYLLAPGFAYFLWMDGKAIVEIVPCDEKNKLLLKKEENKKRVKVEEEELVAECGKFKGHWSKANCTVTLKIKSPDSGAVVTYYVKNTHGQSYNCGSCFLFPHEIKLELNRNNYLTFSPDSDEKEYVLVDWKEKRLLKKDVFFYEDHKEGEVFTVKHEGKVVLEIKCVA